MPFKAVKKAPWKRLNSYISHKPVRILISFIYLLQLSGPSWTVQLGRRDSTTASLGAANSDLPSPLMDLSDLITSFSNKGFTAKEMVALSGKIKLREINHHHN